MAEQPRSHTEQGRRRRPALDRPLRCRRGKARTETRARGAEAHNSAIDDEEARPEAAAARLEDESAVVAAMANPADGAAMASWWGDLIDISRSVNALLRVFCMDEETEVGSSGAFGKRGRFI